ncbi:hypothetical protein ACN38_g13196, partial [Penicillium nordicum]
MTEETGGIK